MLQRSARLQYVLLALVAIFALIHFYLGARKSFDSLINGQERPRIPFFIGSVGHVVRLTVPEAIDAGRRPGDKAITVSFALPEAESAGLHVGDAVLSISGRPFTGTKVLVDEIQNNHPGDSLSLISLRPDGSEARLALKLAPERSMPTPLWAWVLQSFFLLIPFLGLLIGLYVVFARPLNPHAWLILGVLIYFDAIFIQANLLPGRLSFIAILWNTIAQTAMPVCLMLFGIYFPERSRIDIRYSWIKWVIIIPILALFPIDLIYHYGQSYNFNADAWLFPWVDSILYVENILGILAICYFFVCIATKVSSATGDSRRRLRLLYIGTSVSLTPIFILVLIGLIRHTDVGQNMPRWITLPAFTILMLFPITLAYVVVVQRAMDVRILIRQGTKYAFARGTIVIVRVLLAVWLSVAVIRLLQHTHRHAVDIVQIFGIIVLFFAFRFVLSKRLEQKIDQRFFREAYSTEQVLSELSDEARNFTEVTPLLTTVTQRIADTLHIDRIAVFLRSGDTYRLQCAIGAPLAPGALALPASSTTISTLARSRGPAPVYRDDPSSWLVEASDSERAALADLSTELLVPLPGRNQLAGVMALGPKRSEEPYSRMDRQLLQSVASQTGLALENAELVENLTAEVSHRERISREIEIAREVQQHLFPQVTPSIPGIDIAGYCRPAQAVGGDYYDYFILPGTNGSDQRLALALGDISGKGISAALLMASLRASLRSAAQMQPGDLCMLMRHINRLVYESSTANRYATFFYAELDPESRLLTYVNAGHNPPMILRGSEAIPLETTGTVIGLLPDVTFTRASTLLHPGDVLLAYTDGISEAMNAADEEWGEPRMVAAAESLLNRTNSTATAKQLLDCILTEADRFTAGAPQHDDMTMLICSVS